MKCKYCSREIYFGNLKGKKLYFNTDDFNNHTCAEYFKAQNKLPNQTDTTDPQLEQRKQRMKAALLLGDSTNPLTSFDGVVIEQS
jgi:hypothetical protein